MKPWLQALGRLQADNIDSVMVTVASTVGSTPREVGSRIIVTRDSLYGTIGGGNLEYQACRIAREMLSSPQPQQLRRFPLGAGLGQCCGGLVNLLFEPIIGAAEWIRVAFDYERLGREWVREVSIAESGSDLKVRARLAEDEKQLTENYFLEVIGLSRIELTLFGAGHVGRALVNAMRDLPVHVRWVDSREDEFPAQVPGHVEVICTDIAEAEVDAAPSGSCFLVMTHDHALDQSLCEAILQRDDFIFFGLIGSKSKRRMFETRMQRLGIDKDRFSGMTCPIGIEGISGKQPAMIAISVVAQLMQVYDAHSQEKQQEIDVSDRYARGGS